MVELPPQLCGDISATEGALPDPATRTEADQSIDVAPTDHSTSSTIVHSGSPIPEAQNSHDHAIIATLPETRNEKSKKSRKSASFRISSVNWSKFIAQPNRSSIPIKPHPGHFLRTRR